MTHETLQTIFIIVAAVALLIQAVVLVAVALLVLKIRKPVQSIAADVSEVSGIARQRAQQLDPIVGEISRIVLTRTDHADAFAKEILDKGHLQVVSANRIVSDILQRVETVTHETERVIRKPFREAYALTKGVRTALGYAFSRRRPRTNGPYRAV
ncbi:MAG: hypothetical protein WBC04_12315 [Candidatus Acidiferrales bacterium]